MSRCSVHCRSIGDARSARSQPAEASPQGQPITGTLLDQLQTSLGSAHTIERELGGGGMSRVFLATETSLGRETLSEIDALAAKHDEHTFSSLIGVSPNLRRLTHRDGHDGCA